MNPFLKRLRAGSPVYTVEDTKDGFSLVLREDQSEQFSALVREIVEQSGPDYAAFPTSRSGTGYDRVFIMTFG